MPDPSLPSPETVRKTRLTTAATFLVPLALIAVVFRVVLPNGKPPDTPQSTPIPARNGDDLPPPPARVPAFPTGGPTPTGKVTLADLKFDPVRLFPAPFFRVGVRVAGDRLELVDGKSRKTVWAGPVSRARFVQERVAGVQTIKDSMGKVVWSNANVRAKPDLVYCSTAPGQAELRGKDGAVLWAGPQSTLPHSASSRRGPGDRFEVTNAAVTIRGDKGAFSVTDSAGTPLWKGKLPVHPGILLRDKTHYQWIGVDGVEGGTDAVGTITYVCEPGRLTITDIGGKTIGESPFSILRYEELRPAPDSGAPTAARRGPRLLIPIRMNQIRLTRNGTVFLTLRDSAGRIFQRGKVYKADKQSGSMLVG